MSALAARDLAELRRTLQRPGALLAHTVYACPDCDERFVGQDQEPVPAVSIRWEVRNGHLRLGGGGRRPVRRLRKTR